MKNPKLLIITIGSIDHASSRIRAINYVPLLSNRFNVQCFARRGLRNYETTFFQDMLNFIDKHIRKFWLFGLLIFKRYNYLLIQREFIPVLLLRLLKQRQTKILYDVDDAIYLDDPYSFYKRFKFYDGLIVSTPLLQQKFSHYELPIQVVYSPVSLVEPIKKFKSNNPIQICWIGSPSTSKYLKIIEEPLRRLKEDVNYRLVLVGSEVNISGIPLEMVNWTLEEELNVLSKSDIGIMPLTNSEWEEMKGGYKLLLYMSAGIPVVASPVGFNNLIVKDGVNGYLPKTSEQWYLNLKELVLDETLRHKIGINNRKEVELNYDYKVNADKLINFIIATH